jgi:hypothetical protein
MGLNLKYITDKDGNKNGVLVPINDWEKIQKDLEAYEILKNKKTFFEGLSDALLEVSLITGGKKKPNSFDDLINEL